MGYFLTAPKKTPGREELVDPSDQPLWLFKAAAVFLLQPEGSELFYKGR